MLRRQSASRAAAPKAAHVHASRIAAAMVGAAVLVAGCSSVPASSPTGVTPAVPAAYGGSSASSAPSSAPSSAATATPAPSSPATASSTAPTSPATAGQALALQQDFVSVVKQVNPSVVVIETASGLGSGIVFDSKGDIVTNAHVTAGSRTFKVTLADGRTLDGTLVGSFLGDDIAVIHVNATGLIPATFANSSTLAVGDIVLAIGNPLGLQSSVTEGIVSAIGRTVSEGNGAALPNTIQTSAAINPGNSGGALVDLAGQVVGIPTLAASDPQLGGAAVGIGFAISSNMVTDVANQLITSGKVTNSHRAYLGVTTIDATGAPGAVVHSVAPGTPAAAAGIVRGEAITSIDGKATPDSATLGEVLAGLAPGQTVKVVIAKQSGSSTTVTVTLGQLPG
ncbi:MAG: S1C family serine protease [Candidatus Limnocylindrales bacterium]